jgi:predicted negative regulator of RcsB-dependent stress response
MASHLDLEEQEQLDELKHFWKRWGDVITWALIVVLGAYAAWTAWQSWSTRQAAQAAALYDTVERAAILGDVALLERAVADIEDKYASTTYAQQSAMLAARIFSDKDNGTAARKQLQWLIDHGSDEAYQALARLRLAALLMQAQSFDEARKLLTAKVPEAFAPLVADRLGDLASMQKQPAQAVEHYLQAWQGMEPNTEYRRLVAVKLAALGKDPEELPKAEGKK